MKQIRRLLIVGAIGLSFTSCKKGNSLPPLAPGTFTFDYDGMSDTLYGGLDTTSIYGYSVFNASGQPPGFGFTLHIMIQVYYPTYSLKGTYWDTTYVNGPYGLSGDAVNCQLYDDNPNPGYALSVEDNGLGQPFSLHIVSHTGNNIQATFSGYLQDTYRGSSTSVGTVKITNGRLNVNY